MLLVSGYGCATSGRVTAMDGAYGKDMTGIHSIKKLREDRPD
jgi:hypothetical protein